MLFSNIEHLVRNSCEVTGIDCAVFFIRIFRRSLFSNVVKNLTSHATFRFFSHVFASWAIIRECDAFIRECRNRNHCQAVSNCFVRQNVDRFENLSFVILMSSLVEIDSVDSQFRNISNECTANSIHLCSICVCQKNSNCIAFWPAINDLYIHFFHLKNQTRRPRRPPFFFVPS